MCKFCTSEFLCASKPLAFHGGARSLVLHVPSAQGQWEVCTEPCDSGVYGPQSQGGVQSPLAENAVKSIDRFFFRETQRQCKRGDGQTEAPAMVKIRALRLGVSMASFRNYGWTVGHVRKFTMPTVQENTVVKCDMCDHVCNSENFFGKGKQGFHLGRLIATPGSQLLSRTWSWALGLIATGMATPGQQSRTSRGCLLAWTSLPGACQMTSMVRRLQALSSVHEWQSQCQPKQSGGQGMPRYIQRQEWEHHVISTFLQAILQFSLTLTCSDCSGVNLEQLDRFLE